MAECSYVLKAEDWDIDYCGDETDLVDVVSVEGTCIQFALPICLEHLDITGLEIDLMSGNREELKVSVGRKNLHD